MAKRKDKPKRKPAITGKRVRQAEDAPAKPILTVSVTPEVDEDAWDADGLTLKQRRFCEAYVGEAAGNATKAARIAGYRDDNVNALTATASENLTKPMVRQYVARLLARQGMTPGYLESRLAELARSSMDNFLTLTAEGDAVIDVKRATELGCAGQLKELREETIELGNNLVKRKRWIKVHDPIRALETLASMSGLIVHKHQHSGPNGGPIEHAHAAAAARDVIADPELLRLTNALARRRMEVDARRDGQSPN